MKRTNKFDRKRLGKILESYDGNLRMFDTLRSDSYEHRLAAHSLDDLELLYSKVFEPGVSLKNSAPSCPVWPPGSKQEGKRPQETLLQKIHARFTAERGLEDMAADHDMAEAFRRMVKALPASARARFLDQIMTVLGEEVATAKLHGVPVSQQLKPVDRLVAHEKLKLREGNLELKKKRIKLEGRKVKVLEKRCAAAEKSQADGGSITKEGWEQIERDLKLI
jgi:hypothetical protein